MQAYYSLQEMLAAEPELDIVDVTTSGYENGSWHYEPAMEALEAGKHVLVEKPISNEISEAREMVRFAAQQDLYLGCNLNHYFTEPAERAMQYIKEGKIGERVYCLHKVGFNGGDVAYSGPGAARWQRPYAHVKAFLAHPFSVMRYFNGNITHVQAFMTKPGVRKSAGDLMLSINSIHVQFEDGSVGYLLSQRGDAMFGLGGWWSFELAGTKGTFCIENCVEKLHYWPADGRRRWARATPRRHGHRHHRLRQHLPAPHPRLPGRHHERRAQGLSARIRARCPGHPGIHLRGDRVV